jgi:hypothetical protein
MRRLSEHTGESSDTGANQQQICERAERNDHQDVFTSQTLTQNKGVLSSDRNDQCRAEREASCECRNRHEQGLWLSTGHSLTHAPG